MIMESTSTTAKAIQLPVINISQLTSATAKDLVYAATTFGFLYIHPSGTGFTPEVIDRQFELSKRFFAQSVESKAAHHIDTTNRGWGGVNNEILDTSGGQRAELKEVFNIGEFDDVGQLDQQLPAVFEEARGEIQAFQALCERTCYQIVDLIGMGLEVEEDKFFSKRHTKPSASTMRYLYYPALAQDEQWDDVLDNRAGAHSDYGSLTLLFQRPGQPGLEIRTPGDDSWAPVAVIPEEYESTDGIPPIVVNVGDLMTYWSNGLLRSTVHRVSFPRGATHGADRYSMVWFSHPGNDTELVPVPSEIVRKREEIQEGTQVGYGGGSATKRAMTAREHFLNRIEATYTHRKEAELKA